MLTSVSVWQQAIIKFNRKRNRSYFGKSQSTTCLNCVRVRTLLIISTIFYNAVRKASAFASREPTWYLSQKILMRIDKILRRKNPDFEAFLGKKPSKNTGSQCFPSSFSPIFFHSSKIHKFVILPEFAQKNPDFAPILHKKQQNPCKCRLNPKI